MKATSILRSLLYRTLPLYWFLRSGGRVRGTNYRIQRPEQFRVRKGCRIAIGSSVRIDHRVRVVAHADMTVGTGTFVSRDSVLIAFAPVRIGARVLMGERVSLHTENHGPAGRRHKFTTAPITIEDDVWLGANVVVLPGVTIGEGSTVAAGAVVTKDVPPHSLVAGVPARLVKSDLPIVRAKP